MTELSDREKDEQSMIHGRIIARRLIPLDMGPVYAALYRARCEQAKENK